MDQKDPQHESRRGKLPTESHMRWAVTHWHQQLVQWQCCCNNLRLLPLRLTIEAESQKILGLECSSPILQGYVKVRVSVIVRDRF